MWALHGLENALRMAWEVGWALALGFVLSGVVQAWVPRAALQRALGGRGARELTLATGLGAASSSCSYAAIAIARSLFARGASLASAMVFQFASTNLVFELGLVLWVLIGWRFTLAELVGGLVAVVLLWVVFTLLVSRSEEERLRRRAAAAAGGHEHGSAASGLPWRRRLRSLDAWSDVARNVRSDVAMLWKEVAIGLLVAGYVALLPQGFFAALFVHHAPAPLRLVENVLVGPVVAAAAFVCSVGNVPLAAVLWAGGSTFAGVVSFLFADLIIVPIVSAYRRFYGGRFAARLTLVLFGTAALAGLAVDGLFSAAGLVPARRPSLASIAERPVGWGTTSALDLALACLHAALFALTARRQMHAGDHCHT